MLSHPQSVQSLLLKPNHYPILPSCLFSALNMANLASIGSIKGSVNFITGCANGLGRATLRWFLQNGSGPCLGLDQHFDPDFVPKLELNKEQERNLILSQRNTFDDGVDADLADFVKSFGLIDNVVNVAGGALAFPIYWLKNGQVYDLTHLKNLINFNTYGTFNVIRLVSEHMVSKSIGSAPSEMKPKCIINTSCISTTHPSLGQTAYAASKAALDSMTLSIARELSPYNIRCNTINVGYFDTKLIRASEDIVRNAIAENCLLPKRLGEAEEFAHLVNTIIENRMINGCCIKIDAGGRGLVYGY